MENNKYVIEKRSNSVSGVTYYTVFEKWYDQTLRTFDTFSTLEKAEEFVRYRIREDLIRNSWSTEVVKEIEV